MLKNHLSIEGITSRGRLKNRKGRRRTRVGGVHVRKQGGNERHPETQKQKKINHPIRISKVKQPAGRYNRFVELSSYELEWLCDENEQSS